MRRHLIVVLLFFITLSNDSSENGEHSRNNEKLDDTTNFENSFHKLLSSNLYVDRSMFIEQFLVKTHTNGSSRTILITRPRGSGKTVNMDMVKTFLEIEVDENCRIRQPADSKKLFSGDAIQRNDSRYAKKIPKPLEIASRRPDLINQYQGNFPIISISFENIIGRNYQEVEEKLEKTINLTITRLEKHYRLNNILRITEDNRDNGKSNDVFQFVGSSRIKRLGSSLAELSKLLYQHFQRKSFILIDEYDTPILNSYIVFGEHYDFIDVLNLFSDLLRNAFKGNAYLEAGLIDR